jgi:hypothetical protein
MVPTYKTWSTNKSLQFSYITWTHLIINKVHIIIKILNSQFWPNSLIFKSVADSLFVMFYNVIWNDWLHREETYSNHSVTLVMYLLQLLHRGITIVTAKS